jgi:hypothetical protein
MMLASCYLTLLLLHWDHFGTDHLYLDVTPTVMGTLRMQTSCEWLKCTVQRQGVSIVLKRMT